MKFFKFLLRVVAILLVVAVAGGAAVHYLLPEGTISSLIGIGHNHNLTKVEKIEATCTEVGQEAYYVCDGCDKIFSDVNGINAIDAPKAIEALGHKIIGVAGVEPTCTESGTEDCYKCSRCEQLYADAQGNTEIEAAPSVPAIGHTLVKTDAKEVSCTENGNSEYWTCSTCKKVYVDAEGKNETTVVDQVIISEGHALVKTDAKEATCTEDGNVAYWTCSVCDKIYSDEAAENEIVETVISAIGHTYADTLVIEGATTTYEPGSNFVTSGLAVKLACTSCTHTEIVTDYSISKTENLQSEDTSVVISYVAGEKEYSATVKITVIHTHVLGDKVDAVAPTCTEKGALAYYECNICHNKYEDSAAEKLLESIDVDALGHKADKTEAKASTCTEAGHNEYWICSVCNNVFADEACTVITTVEEQQLPLVNHDTELKSDSEGHWYECKNCDYNTEKASHEGMAYPGEFYVCDICNASFGTKAGWEGWVEYRPSTNVGSSATASRETVEGIWATRYVISAGTTSLNIEHEDRNTYYAGMYQVRVPAVSGIPTYVYLRVINNSSEAVSFTFQNHSQPEDGVFVSLGGNESGWFKFNVTDNTIGGWYQILMDEGNSGADVTIYGYFYTGNLELDNLQIANKDSLKLSYEVGEKFDISGLILSANIIKPDGSALADYNAEIYHIASNYTVSGLTNGQVLEEGTHTVTVSLGDKSVELEIVVSSHAHNIVFVPYVASTCDTDGNIAHYMCDIDGCGQFFSDAEGNTPISASDVVIAKGHSVAQLPGTAEYCTRCGEILGTEIMSNEHWVLFRPEIAVGSGSFAGWKAEYTDVDGVYGSMLTFGADVNAGDRISVTAGNNQGNFQTIIPNGLDATVANRTVIMYYHNYGTEPITLRYENDSNSNIYDEVTIPAGGVVVSTFEHPKSGGGSNWFYLQVKNDIQSDVTVGVYGYFYLDCEFDSISVVNNANKLSFVAGETFSAEGLMLKTSGGIKTTFIETGYVTDLDGYVFTDTDIGNKTVTVTFGGKQITYEIEITAHKHQTEQIAGKEAVKCLEDGYESYYRCTVEGCGLIFSDAEGNNRLTAPVVIPMPHSDTEIVVDGKLTCGDCNAFLSNWVFYNITTNYNNNGVVNGKIEAADIDGVSGSMIYIGAGTVSGSNFQLCMGDNDAYRQTVIPNLGSGVQSGELRHVIVFYKNYGTEDITLNLQNDSSGGNGSVTIPAGGTAVCEFDIHNVGGSNWFNLYVDSNVTTDVQIGAYGYIYVNDSEVGDVSINSQATATSFKVGDTFTSEGLVLSATIPSSNTKTLYVTTGYTTNYDGVVFEEAGTYEVVVTFAGISTTYEITVE